MGFRHYLEITLPKNLRDNDDMPGIEFVIVDYSSPDGLGEWLSHNFQSELANGRLRYYRVNGFNQFCLAHAKNISHRLGCGEILCNLDADNFTGKGFSKYLVDFFKQNPHSVLHSPLWSNGTCGRVALRKHDFEALGGYDERMIYGWGYEDTDFLVRAKLMGLSEAFIPTDSPFLTALQHGNTERVRFYPTKDKQKSKEIHEALSVESIRSGSLVANPGASWGNPKGPAAADRVRRL
jgi:hypothetical protein